MIRTVLLLPYALFIAIVVVPAFVLFTTCAMIALLIGERQGWARIGGLNQDDW